MSRRVPQLSPCCHRPSWALVAQALAAERDDIRERLEAEYAARGLAVVAERQWALYQSLRMLADADAEAAVTIDLVAAVTP